MSSAESFDQEFEAAESAAREARRAEFMAERQEQADEQARETEHAQRKQAARVRQGELGDEHKRLKLALRSKMKALGALYEQLNEIVGAIETDVLQNAALQREYDQAAVVSGVRLSCGPREVVEPLDLELVRLAIGHELGESWDDTPSVDPALVDTMPAVVAAQRLEQPGSPLEFHRRVQAVQAETEHALGSAPLSRWLAIGVEPAWGDHSPSAERSRRAAGLLLRLKEHDHV